MHFRCVFTLLQWCVLVGLDCAEPMMFLSLHVTCSCIFHLYVPSFIFIVILIYAGAFLHVSLSLSLSLLLSVSRSMAPKRKSTSSQNPLLFWGIFFFWHHSFSCTVQWRQSTKGLFKELLMTRHSFRTPSHSIRLFRYWPSHYHLHLGLGVIVWHLGHLCLCDHIGVSLQHARIRYFSTSVCHSH